MKSRDCKPPKNHCTHTKAGWTWACSPPQSTSSSIISLAPASSAVESSHTCALTSAVVLVAITQTVGQLVVVVGSLLRLVAACTTLIPLSSDPSLCSFSTKSAVLRHCEDAARRLALHDSGGTSRTLTACMGEYQHVTSYRSLA